jgi:hypothetical protein
MGTSIITTETAPAQRTPFLPRELVLELTDSAYRLDGWDASEALRRLRRNGLANRLSDLVERNAFALQPCDGSWLVDRLSALMMAMGNERDEKRIAAWLAETTRLLRDIPQDILADAIDEAVKRSDRGFLPAVGQVRAIADPALEHRKLIFGRLERLRNAHIMTPLGEPPQADTAGQCTPEQAAAILAEYGFKGLAPQKGPKPLPTIDDYIAIGLSWEEAERTLAAQISRLPGKAVGEVRA